MGQARVSLVYLDACVVIYLVEGAEPFHTKARDEIKSLMNREGSELITSRISLIECRSNPMRKHDAETLRIYDGFFAADQMSLADVDAGIIESATRLRAEYGFRTPDAIHLATAIEHGAEVFLTGDTTLSKCREIKVSLLT